MEDKPVLGKKELSLISSFFVNFRKDVFLYLVHNVKSKEIAEDIMSVTYLKAIQVVSSGKYKEIGKPKAWLMQIAHNEMINHFRSKKVKLQSFVSEDKLNNFKTATLNPEDSLVKSDIEERLLSFVELLPAKQRDVIYLRIYKQLTFKEIHSLTGENSNTMRVRYHKAIISLRKLVEMDESFKAPS